MRRFVLVAVALLAACGSATTEAPSPADIRSTCQTDDDCGLAADRCAERRVCDAGQCALRAAVVCGGVAGTCQTLRCEPETGACRERPADGPCDDGNACSLSDHCEDGQCVGAPRDCDDGSDCTVEACDPALGCTLAPAAEGAPCTGACLEAPSCASGVCAGPPTDCDDGLACTADTCVPGLGCVSTNAPLACDDGDPCTGDDRCAVGVCAGLALSAGAACDDKDPCTSGESCDPSGCQGGSPTLCAADGNPCTSDACSGPAGCAYEPFADGTTCADPSSCREAGLCAGGLCTSSARPNGTECAPAASCRAAAGCLDGACPVGALVPAGTPCAPADACLSAAFCDSFGTCNATATVDCDDKNPCTADGCSTASGCVHTPVGNGATCVGACGLVGVCNGSTCLGGDPCEGFGGPCDVWTCGPTGGCVPAGFEADGTACGTTCLPATCAAGACLKGAPVDCFDGNSCLLQGCDNATGCKVLATSKGLCNADSDACTLLDTCSAGVCTPGNGCDDFESCTFDSCEAGTCLHVWDSACGGEALCDDGVDNDLAGGTDCLDQSCERAASACRGTRPVPWVVDVGDAGLGFSAGPGLVWTSGTVDSDLRLDVSTGGATFEVTGSASVCCVDGESALTDLWLTFSERVSLPGGPGCVVEPDSFVVRTVQVEAPFTSKAGGPLSVVQSSYHVLSDDGCGEWKARAVRIKRGAINASPTPGALRVRFLARVQTVQAVGSWEIDAVRVVGAEDCSNGQDDNGDALVDCEDPVCAADAACGF